MCTTKQLVDPFGSVTKNSPILDPIGHLARKNGAGDLVSPMDIVGGRDDKQNTAQTQNSLAIPKQPKYSANPGLQIS